MNGFEFDHVAGLTLPDLVADDVLLTPGEVARLFRVSPRTVARWEVAGRLRAVKTLGGHRRFKVAEVRTVLARVAAVGGPGVDRHPE